MDRTVEMEIIAVIAVLAVVGAYFGQFNILQLVAVGLIGYLSHDLVNSDDQPAIEDDKVA